MGGTITANKVITHPYCALGCFICVCFVLPRYGLIAMMIGSATVLTALVAVLPESFRSRSGSTIAATCLAAVLWVAAAITTIITFSAPATPRLGVETNSGNQSGQFFQKQELEQPPPTPAETLPQSYHDFDQMPGKGWRALADQKRFTEAARMIECFLAKQAKLTTREKANLHFHAAQCLAIEGSAQSIAGALVHLKDSRANPELPESSTPQKDQLAVIGVSQQWNDYVEATEAFLKGDLPTLKASRERMASGLKINGEVVNLDVVDRLIAKFGKSYAEAYLTDANADQKPTSPGK